MSILAVFAPRVARESLLQVAAGMIRKEANTLLQLSKAIPSAVEDAVHLISNGP